MSMPTNALNELQKALGEVTAQRMQFMRFREEVSEVLDLVELLPELKSDDARESLVRDLLHCTQRVRRFLDIVDSGRGPW